jgi:competence protein ComEC
VVLVIAAFVAGISCLQVQERLPTLDLALLMCVPLVVWLVLERRWASRPTDTLIVRIAERSLRKLTLTALAFGIGFFWAAFCAHTRLADELASAWEGRDVRVIGVVARLPYVFERGVRFEFDVEQAWPEDARAPKRIVLTWYGAWRKAPPAADLPAVRAGERWEMTVRLRRPHGTANPHGFDYESWLMERGVRATGYVRPGESTRRLTEFVPHPVYAIERVRESTRARILDALPGAPYAGVVVALVMGDQRAIAQAQWTVFTRTGVNHLMSISGLHVTMIAALVFTLVNLLWRRSQRLTLWLPARHAATLAGLLAALSYAALAGFAVPAQRTVYMLCVVAAALWLKQLTAARTILTLALLVVTVLDPWAVMAPGFWLSFGAVAVILYVCVGPVRPPHWLIAWLRTQWAVTLGLVPLLLAMFQQVSLISPIANALAIPIVSLVVVPLALIGTVLPFDAVLALDHALVVWLMAALTELADLPASVWQQHAPPLWAVVGALCGAAYMLLPRGWPGRWIGIAGFLPLFLAIPEGPANGAVRLAILDVGQGLAVVVRTREHALIYDAGPRYSADVDSGNRIVVPYLRATGIRYLDGVIVTHADNDHSGGAASVLSAVPVDWLLSSLPATSELQSMAPQSMPCYGGQHWVWNAVLFEIVHPRLESHSQDRLKSNDRSCVLRITAGVTRILLTGDIEAKSERELLVREGERLRADILVAPHHGSTTSSTSEFLAAVSPRTTIFTVGYRNRFGHPRPAVLQRYQDIGSRILRSDHHGAVLIDIDGRATTITLQRDARRRYWHNVPRDTGVNLDDG